MTTTESARREQVYVDAIELLTMQRDYLLGKLVLDELELRGDTAVVGAGRFIWLREQERMSAPDDDDPFGLGLSAGLYRAIGRGRVFKKPDPEEQT